MFGNCPHRYAAEYVHEVENGNNVTRRGSTFHRARELYIRMLWETRQTDDLDFAVSAISRAVTELPLPFAEELDCRDLWMRFVERFTLPLSTYYACETELAIFSTVLRYDLVVVPTPHLLILDDAKTNWNIPSQAALDSAYQPAMYLAAARRLFPGFQRYQFRFDFIRFNQFRFVEKTDAELDEIEQSIEDQDAAMGKAEAEGVFPATGGAHCGTCVVKTCPVVGNALRHGGRLTSPADASEAIREAAALHRALELREQALRAYSAEHGPVSAGGVEWSHRPVERRVYPAAKVLGVLEESGTEFPLYLNGTAVKPLLTSRRKYKAVESSIKALAISTVKTEFRPKVVVEADEREYQDED